MPFSGSVVPSEEATLVDQEQDILSQISTNFRVSETKYGGKGCFSYGEIPRGSTILVSKPLAFTISKEFKKEVCHFCFAYNNGRAMKTKFSLPGFKNQSICFCSDDCLQQFQKVEDYQLYTSSLLNVEKNYINHQMDEEEPGYNDVGASDFIHLIKQKWEQVEEWDTQVKNMKSTKWPKLIPHITESEYSDIKYCLGVLHKMLLKDKHSFVSDKFLDNLEGSEYLSFEMSLFELLQSNEVLKVLRFRNLLDSYIRIFKFLRLTSPPEFQKFITPLNVRLMIGNNLTNAFGIWTLDSGDKEFLGFGVYPSGSFFNHSCEPNIIKKRINNELHFITLRDIEKNEELCIDYGNYLDEPVEIRRKQLSEWFFTCACQRCERESS